MPVQESLQIQIEQQNLTGPLTAGAIGRVSPALAAPVAAAHTNATSALPAVAGTTTTLATLASALDVLVTNFLMRYLEFYCLRASDLLKLR